MRMLIVGDTHGGMAAVDKAVSAALGEGCDRIIQVGDFGFWPHFTDGRQFMKDVDALCNLEAIPLYWVDGNHENHEILDLMADTKDHFVPMGDSGSIFYCPRGFSWDWQGTRFMSLGGAYSIDKDYRTPGRSWWPGETITDDDVTRALASEQVDVMFTHDAPVGTVPWLPDAPADRKKDQWPESRVNREQVSKVVDALHPEWLFHGHYHYRYEGKVNDTVVHGLAADGAQGSMLVFNVEEGTVWEAAS